MIIAIGPTLHVTERRILLDCETVKGRVKALSALS